MPGKVMQSLAPTPIKPVRTGIQTWVFGTRVLISNTEAVA